MAKKTIKCPKCDRKFSMAAHLARHKSAAHGSGKKKAAKKKTRRIKKRGVRQAVRKKPAGGRFKCKRCGFRGKSAQSLKIHVGRMHGTAKKKKRLGRRKVAKKTARRAGRKSGLGRLSLAELAGLHDACKAELANWLKSLL